MSWSREMAEISDVPTTKVCIFLSLLVVYKAALFLLKKENSFVPQFGRSNT
jgi:hypothetical protein